MDQRIYSVTELTREIKELLERSFPRLWVEGEISNFKRHSSGHLYFTLKDANSQISCAMWRFRAGSLRFHPEHGMKVLVEGDIQVYERGGNYQLIVAQIQPAGGVGALQLAFEQLKKKLHAEGLFDEAHKQPLPPYPARIGVITSPTGAAIRDIISVLRRRAPGVELLIYPVRVQGEEAAEEIAAAIDSFNRYGKVDVLIIGRGGGSLEDLWAFNEEMVARAIYRSRIPIISAVGHEVDYSIADFVADYRAATPSAAAEVAVRDQAELKGQLAYYRERLQKSLLNRIEGYRNTLESIRSSYAFRRPQDQIFQSLQQLDELQRRLTRSMSHRIAINTGQLETLRKQLLAMNPRAILNRGYSITYKNGQVVKDAALLARDDQVKVVLAKGSFQANVNAIGDDNE